MNSEHVYQVEIGVDWQVAISDWIEGRNKVLAVCSEKFPISLNIPVVQIPDGESGKSAETVAFLWQRFGEVGISRGDLIIAIGGGAVTDVTGFAAATWQRGVDWLAIPTTLAAMVDAAIGGKTGINTELGKNLVGAFHSPVGVLIDLDFLKTLPERDFSAGMAEVIKCGFIADQQILNSLQDISLSELIADNDLQQELIFRAVSVKAEVVSSDFRESFHREILNYGHTLGHAVEKDSGYQLRHGEAISIGLCFAAELSGIKNGLTQDVIDRHRVLLHAMNLPTRYPVDAWPNLLKSMESDKKNRNGQIRFVGLEKVGRCNRLEGLSFEDLAKAYGRISK